MSFAKVKSWSVKVVEGYISNNQVRSVHCQGCDSATKIVVGNNDDPNLILYGCAGHKCKHTLIRMDFGAMNHWAEASVKSAVAKDFPFSANINITN